MVSERRSRRAQKVGVREGGGGGSISFVQAPALALVRAAWIGEPKFTRDVQQFRGGLVFEAHRLVYHSPLGLRVKKKKKMGVGGLRPLKFLTFLKCLKFLNFLKSRFGVWGLGFEV